MLRPLLFCHALTAAVSLDLSLHGLKASREGGGDAGPYNYSRFLMGFRPYHQMSPEELAYRHGLFQASMARLSQIRQIPNRHWEAGVTKFMDYSDAEYAVLLGYKARRSRAGEAGETKKMSVTGWIPPAAAVRGGQLPSAADSAAAEAEGMMPTALNLVSFRSDSLSMVRDQGRCGSCWVDVALTAIEGAMVHNHTLMRTLRELGYTNTLSRDSVLGCATNPLKCGGEGGCSGAATTVAFNQVRQDGVAFARDVPGDTTVSSLNGATPQCIPKDPHQPRIGIHSFVRMPRNSPTLIQELLKRNAPIAVAVDATNWRHYSHGVYVDTDLGPGDFNVNHMVSLMGYDTSPNPRPYYLLKNSWGTDFGELGFIRIELKAAEASHCGRDRDTHKGTACMDEPKEARACGTCGILFDAAYPVGPYVIMETPAQKIDDLSGGLEFRGPTFLIPH